MSIASFIFSTSTVLVTAISSTLSVLPDLFKAFSMFSSMFIILSLIDIFISSSNNYNISPSFILLGFISISSNNVISLFVFLSSVCI